MHLYNTELNDKKNMYMLGMVYKCSLCKDNIDCYRACIILRTSTKVDWKLEFTNRHRILETGVYK